MSKRRRPPRTGDNASNGANLGFEGTLWAAADKLRGNMDAAEYKHVVLGLIFLKYISDAFAERHSFLQRAIADPASEYFVADEARREAEAALITEDKDEYTAAQVFWVPPEARWDYLQRNAKRPEIGKLIDAGMTAIERDNPRLKGVLPKDYARPALDKARVGELIDMIATVGLGDAESRSKDILGRVYEYFLGQFAAAEGKLGGQFYTPRCVVKLLVEMIEPFRGRVYDPCCGSGGMFVQAVRFIEAHATCNGPKDGPHGDRHDISIYGQESNYTTWRLCQMNLAIRGIDGNIAWNEQGSFVKDGHKDLKADYVLANPPFNDSDWSGQLLREDARWRFGTPPAGNANYAWIQHFIHHLAPNGVAGFVMANGAMSSNQSGEGDIRKAIIESDLVDCMIALPGQLFYTTQIPACLWFLTRNKRSSPGGRGQGEGRRDRRGRTLFIDARKMGALIDRTHRDLTDDDICRIATTYHAWRGEPEVGGFEAYEDTPGFCKDATLEEIRAHGHVLTPGRYVGAEEVEDDGEPFEEKMRRLVGQLDEQFAESERLAATIRGNLEGLGYGG